MWFFLFAINLVLISTKMWFIIHAYYFPESFVLPMQHNFTDGMALGSAFLLHGTVGGWSRTIFLLAHEIPQEV